MGRHPMFMERKIQSYEDDINLQINLTADSMQSFKNINQLPLFLHESISQT